MKKLISGMMLLLTSLTSLADEAVVAAVPQIDADPTAMILFAVVFVAMIGGFAGYIWLKERAKNDSTKR